MVFWQSCLIGGRAKPVYSAESNAKHPLATARIERELTAAKPFVQHPPEDIALFCPSYGTANTDQKVAFWRTLYHQLITYESHFNPNSTMWEINSDNHARDEYSIGIFQLSVSNSNGRECNFPTEWDVLNPDRNWQCGFSIIDRDLRAQPKTKNHPAYPSLIGGESDKRLKWGMASYFGTLRSYSSARALIIQVTSRLPGCLNTP